MGPKGFECTLYGSHLLPYNLKSVFLTFCPFHESTFNPNFDLIVFLFHWSRSNADVSNETNSNYLDSIER